MPTVDQVRQEMFRVEEAKAALKMAGGNLSNALNGLRASIRNGHTTGDRLQDLVLQAGGGIDDPMLPKLRELEVRLKGKAGEFVLFHWVGDVRLRFGGAIRDSDFTHREMCRIGVLSGEDLVLYKEVEPCPPTIALPVERFLNGTWAWSFMSTTFEHCPYESGDFFAWTEEERPPSLLVYLANEHAYKNLLIGDEEVRAALKETRDEAQFAAAANWLGRLVLQPTD